jgi:hypothetical protein
MKNIDIAFHQKLRLWLKFIWAHDDHKNSVMNIFGLLRFLMLNIVHNILALDNIIKTCENLHVGEQNQLILRNHKKVWTSHICLMGNQEDSKRKQISSNWWILIANQFIHLDSHFQDHGIAIATDHEVFIIGNCKVSGN